MREFLYLIGPPGVGKSASLAAALAGVPCEARPGPPAHLVYPGGAQIGAIRAGHPGTDALPMNAIVAAKAWVARRPYPALVAEGDRLACDAFFAWVENYGYRLTVVSLWAPPAVLTARRKQRGSAQDPSWMKGRETKAAGLAQRWMARVLDAGRTTEQIAAELRLQPAIRILRGEA